jgi:elongation factor P
MIETSDFARGVCIQFKGQPMMITDVSFSTPTARGANTIARTKLKNLLTGQILNESIRSGERFEEVDLAQHPCTYLYSDGRSWHFMDEETYEQFELTAQQLEDQVGFLKEGQQDLRALYVDGKLVSIKLPTTVDLLVVETDPAIKGATAKAQMKPAKVETGLVVQVPPYLESGELIRIDTRDAHFVERVKK